MFLFVLAIFFISPSLSSAFLCLPCSVPSTAAETRSWTVQPQGHASPFRLPYLLTSPKLTKVFFICYSSLCTRRVLPAPTSPQRWQCWCGRPGSHLGGWHCCLSHTCYGESRGRAKALLGLLYSPKSLHLGYFLCAAKCGCEWQELVTGWV